MGYFNKKVEYANLYGGEIKETEFFNGKFFTSYLNMKTGYFAVIRHVKESYRRTVPSSIARY